MPQVKTWLKTDLSKPITVISLENEMFTFDNQGNMIGVEVYDNGEPVTLTGDIIGYVIRPDGNTVYIEGESTENKATIVLPDVAYAFVGQITIVIRCVNGVQKTVIAACKAHVTCSRTNDIVDPGEVIPSVESLPVVIIGIDTYYQASNNGSTVPTGTWSETVPEVLPGYFLWQKEVIHWNNGQDTIIYTHSQYGRNGTGDVSGVKMNGTTYEPDGNGIVDLGAVGELDDNAGSGDTTKVWSADKLATAFSGKAGTNNSLDLTLAAGSWSSAYPRTQTLSATGVTASNIILFGLASDATLDEIEAYSAGKIMCTAQSTGEITISCFGEEPDINLPVTVVILG